MFLRRVIGAVWEGEDGGGMEERVEESKAEGEWTLMRGWKPDKSGGSIDTAVP